MFLTLRPARPDDAAPLLALIKGLAAYEREPDAVETTEADLRAQLATDPPPFRCLIAEWEGAPAGFCLFFQSYSTWRGRPGIYLEDLFVLPELRGRGIGKALLAALARHTLAIDGRRLEWAVLDWNAPAIAFYESLGAAPLSEWTTWRLDREALRALAASGPPLPQTA